MKLQKRLTTAGNEKQINKALDKMLKKNNNISVHATYKYKGSIFTKRVNDSVILDNEFKLAETVKSKEGFFSKLFMTKNKLTKLIKAHRDRNIYKCSGFINRKDHDTFWVEIRNIDNSFRTQSKFLRVTGDKVGNKREVMNYVKRTVEQINSTR